MSNFSRNKKNQQICRFQWCRILIYPKRIVVLNPKDGNYYMVDHAEYLIGVFDNQKKLRSGTAQTVNYALHQGKVITLIHPDTMEITAPAP